MGGVHRVLHDLQPVAGVEVLLAWDEPIARANEAVVEGQRRPLLGRPHVGEDDAAILVGGISAVKQAVLQGAVCRLARGLKDGPVRREQPAVVAASNSLGIDQPELQGRAAMRAV